MVFFYIFKAFVKPSVQVACILLCWGVISFVPVAAAVAAARMGNFESAGKMNELGKLFSASRTTSALWLGKTFLIYICG